MLYIPTPYLFCHLLHLLLLQPIRQNRHQVDIQPLKEIQDILLSNFLVLLRGCHPGLEERLHLSSFPLHDMLDLLVIGYTAILIASVLQSYLIDII